MVAPRAVSEPAPPSPAACVAALEAWIDARPHLLPGPVQLARLSLRWLRAAIEANP